ncbi:acetyl-CoA carboxylase biotin carboxyl carrier protein subunit [Candidatus Riflebacteria bacterium]
MDYKFCINETGEINLESEAFPDKDGFFHISIAGTTYKARLEGQKLLINNRSYWLNQLFEPGKFELDNLPFNYALTQVGNYQRKKVVSKDQQKTVTSPLNGNIWKVLVKEGEKVTKGQVILIIEAMKMENEISTPGDGIIKEISVTEGSGVKPGETLFILE